MARTIQTIFDQIKGEAQRLANEIGNQALIDMLNNTSRVAIWKQLFYAVAFGVYMLETLFDLFRTEIDETIAKLKPHSSRWYAEKSKAFMYGLPLVNESDYYDTTGMTDDQIANAQIISHAAVVEAERGIRIKVAKTAGADLTALTAGELAAFTEYVEEIKDAGIKVIITSSPPDSLKASLRIFYNPLVLRGDGGRIDGNNEQPVQEAFKNYLKKLPFNGLFVPQLMIDQLQAVDGVVIVKDESWQARYGVLDYEAIDYQYLPDSGYLRIDDIDLSLQFIPHAVI